MLFLPQHLQLMRIVLQSQMLLPLSELHRMHRVLLTKLLLTVVVLPVEFALCMLLAVLVLPLLLALPVPLLLCLRMHLPRLLRLERV